MRNINDNNNNNNNNKLVEKVAYLNAFSTFGCKVMFVAWYTKDFIVLWYEALASDRCIT